jgi:hypothetical protein
MRKLITLLLLSIGTTAVAQPEFDGSGEKFKKAVADKDFGSIADMMQFPFNSWDWGYLQAKKSDKIETREEFMKIFDKIFTKQTLQVIRKESFKKLEGDDKNIYYTLAFMRNDKGAQWIVFKLVNGEWKATGTDHVSWSSSY